MEKLTKRERNAFELAERERQRTEARVKFTAELPLKLLQLMARAHPYAKCYAKPRPEGVALSGFTVHFEFHENAGDGYELSLMSEEWEVASLADALDELEEKKAMAAAKRKLAAETWDVLTPEQREALGLSKARPAVY